MKVREREEKKKTEQIEKFDCFRSYIVCTCLWIEKERDSSYRHKQNELDYVNSNSDFVWSTRITLRFQSSARERKMKYRQVLRS